MATDFGGLAGKTLGGPRSGVRLDARPDNVLGEEILGGASTRMTQSVDVVESVEAERARDDGSSTAAGDRTPDLEVVVGEWGLLENEACR